MHLLHLVAALCCLGTGFAVPTATIKWCVVSDQEVQKCQNLASQSSVFICEHRDSPAACITAIKAGEADAATLSGEFIYKAGRRNNDLVPILVEDYRRANSEACSYSVAVAKKGSTFGLHNLRGKKSCHSGLGTSEGWILPIGTLLSKGEILWAGSDNQPLLQVVSEFFSQSCVPGSSGYPNLCQLCRDDCSTSSTNQYFGSAGAFKCLSDDVGEVAFMDSADIPENEKNQYELLCLDNSRTAVENYKTCNLGRDPARAVVTRSDKVLASFISESLKHVTGGEDYQQLPPDTDSFLYLGAQYTDKLQAIFKEQPQAEAATGIRWCAVGPERGPETAKCDLWNGNSFIPETETSAIECQTAPTVEECFKKIMRHEADAIAVDGGQVYTAGQCGLIPVMAEQYDEAKCSSPGASSPSSYFAVAVVKKGSGHSWANLKGKRSCHTGIGRTAGWNIPMGLIHKELGHCDFTQFFSSGCAPGADLTSPFCTQCKGSGKSVGDESKCHASADELYYGYAGAFRCLAEEAGDVAFIKHTIVGENTNGIGPDWAAGLRSDQFELICPGKPGSYPVSDFETCHLASVPAHAVVTRPDMRSEVIRVLSDQQIKFGRNGSSDRFRMFQSTDGKNLLFKDSTKCLQEVQSQSYETFLGSVYMTAMRSLRQCTGNTPDLEKSCTFQSCP